jgi:outer membrane receptor for ferrienterochelin and colicin
LFIFAPKKIHGFQAATNYFGYTNCDKMILSNSRLPAGSIALYTRKQQHAFCLLTLLMLCLLQGVAAQVSITGTVEGEEGDPIPYANVLLLQPGDSALVAGTITNDDGGFVIRSLPGNYLISISIIGYQTIFSGVSAGAAEEELHIGNFYLHEDISQLEEIVVMGQKPLYEKQTDRTVVNVKGSITAAGSTVLEVLEKSPGVMVNRQNNSVTMNGKNGVLVMVNGKASRLPMDAVVQMLDGMSSATVEKIELITSPPAKYDAEGNAGIIHIVMEESPDAGTNGNFSITLGYARAETLGAGLNLNRRTKRLNTFLGYSIQRQQNRHEWFNEYFTTTNNFTQTNISDSQRKPLTTVQNLRTGLEYTISNKTTASLLVTGYRRNWKLDAETISLNAVSPDTTFHTNMLIREINKWQSATGSLGLRHKVDDRQEIGLAFDYLYYHNNNPSTYDNKTTLNDSPNPQGEVIHVEKKTPIHFRVVNIDYTNEFNSKWSVDAGAKGTLSQFTNRVLSARTTLGETKIDPEFTNDSDLDEKILAVYGSWNWQPHADWTIGGGLRYEHTSSVLTSPAEGLLLDRSFGNFFPNLSVVHDLSKEAKILIVYNRRITRPTFNDMAPFVFYVGPKTFVAGNLSLKPAITDAFDFSYQFKQWWVSLRYSHSDDEIALLQPEFNPATNEQIFRSQNLKSMRTFGISTTFPVGVTSWWEMQNDVSFYFHRYETQHLVHNVSRNVNNFILNTTSAFTLPRDFSIELSGSYQAATLWGISQFEPMGQVNLGIKKKLKNEATITLAFNDMFNTLRWRIRTEVSEVNVRSYMRYDWGTRSLNLTYTHNFGNRKLNAVDLRSGSEAERKRVQ